MFVPSVSVTSRVPACADTGAGAMDVAVTLVTNSPSMLEDTLCKFFKSHLPQAFTLTQDMCQRSFIQVTSASCATMRTCP